MAEVIASTLIEAVFKKLGDVAMKKVGRVQGIRSELKSLEKTLYRIQALLVDASDKEIKDVLVQKWLNDLKHVAYDIDDILDDLATDAMHREFVKNSGASTSKVRKFVSSCCTNFSVCAKTYHELDDINLRLQELENEQKKIGLEVKYGGLEVRDTRSIDPNRGLETSVLDGCSIVGRQVDTEELIDKLLGDDPLNKNFSIVPIVGMGGVGKTTLARILYNDERVKSHFELKGWVCVSDKWDSVQISKNIYESVGGKEKYDNFNSLQVALQDKLSEKKILLVLDDIWTENPKDWDTLVRPLGACTHGSKVIITTRKHQLLNKLGYTQLNPLQCLSDNDALSLFWKHARDANDVDPSQKLKAYGEEIVRNCKGLPLALIALGRLLRRKDGEERWKEVVDSQIWRLEEGGGIINALKLSYHELPASLKQLFAYCSLFPKDDLFEKDGLVLLWMAEGFLHQSDPSKTEESLGRDYFEELLSRSFFQHAPDDKSLFVMHDLMHDLATSVAGEFFFRLEKDMARTLAGELRHMSFVPDEHEAYEKFMVFKKANCLRTLRTFLSVGVTKWWRIYFLPNDVLADLLPQLPLLRVINLSNCMIQEVPKCIGSLKHLRYINFSRTDITNLPENVCDLCNLQTLIVSRCHNLTMLPNNVSMLKNLRHLDFRDCGSLVEFSFKGEAVFPCLKELPILRCSSLVKFSFEGDKVFPCLKELCIKEFPSLVEFSFKGDAVFPCLKELRIENCPSLVKFSFKGDAVFPCLKKLRIKECPSLVEFSFEGDAVFSCLKELHIDDCRSLDEVLFKGENKVFPFLEELRIEFCSNLLEVSVEALPSLRVLTLAYCGDGVLRSVVRVAPSVTELYIHSISGLTNEVWRGVILDLKAVEELDIRLCGEIRYLWESKEAEAVSKVLVNLRKLTVIWCRKLVSLGEKDYNNGEGGEKISDHLNVSKFSHLTSLTDLILQYCPNIDVPADGLWPPNLCRLKIGQLKKPISEWGPQKFPSTLVDLTLDGETPSNWSRELSHIHIPSSLTRLEIFNFEKLETVSEGLQHLTSLQHLKIWGCPKLKDLPETLLPSLLSLKIIACPILEERCSEGGGPYWPHISHIPDIKII